MSVLLVFCPVAVERYSHVSAFAPRLRCSAGWIPTELGALGVLEKLNLENNELDGERG